MDIASGDFWRDFIFMYFRRRTGRVQSPVLSTYTKSEGSNQKAAETDGRAAYTLQMAEVLRKQSIPTFQKMTKSLEILTESVTNHPGGCGSRSILRTFSREMSRFI